MPGRLFSAYLAAAVCCAVWLAGCAARPTSEAPQVVKVYASSAAYPWLGAAFDCAPASIAIEVADPDSAAMSLRLGEGEHLKTPSYKIGVDDVLVVVHPQNGVTALTLDQAREIFAGEVTNWKAVGGADMAVQVWAYSPAVDVQLDFDGVVLQGRPVASGARLAVSAQAMSDSVGSVPGSIGILPRRWKAGNTREALEVSSFPVLAVLKSEPLGALRDLVGCLQAKK